MTGDSNGLARVVISHFIRHDTDGICQMHGAGGQACGRESASIMVVINVMKFKTDHSGWLAGSGQVSAHTHTRIHTYIHTHTQNGNGMVAR